MPLMQYVEFQGRHFRHPIHGGSGGGWSLSAHCGNKTDYASALEFWLWSLQFTTGQNSDNRFFRLVAEEAVCEPITNREYYDRVETYVANLKHDPPDFLFRQDLVSAMKVLEGALPDGSLRNSLLGEFEEVYIAIHDCLPL